MPEDDDSDFDLDLELDLDAEPPAPAPAPAPAPPQPQRPRPKPVEKEPEPVAAEPEPTPTPAPPEPEPTPAEPAVEDLPLPSPERPATASHLSEPRPEPEEPAPAESALQAAATRRPTIDASPPPDLSDLGIPEAIVPSKAPEPEFLDDQIPLPGNPKSSQALDLGTPQETPPSASEQVQIKRRKRRRRTESQPEQRPRPQDITFPTQSGSPLKKKLLIGIPIALVAIVIISKLLSDKKPDEPLLNVREIQEKARNTPPPEPVEPPPTAPEIEPAPIDRSSETPDERNDRAEATLGHFFGATKESQMLAYVRHPKRVSPLMVDYYNRVPFKTHEFLGLNNDLQAAESIGPNFYAAEADLGGPRSQTMILEDTPKGFRIDWEYYVQYNPMDWSTFLKEAPADAMDFRVYANLVPSFRHPFTDESRYIGVLLMTLNDTSEIMGYAERNSELGIRLEEFLKNKHEELCILRLQFPTGPNPDTVYIRELVNPHWIITDETPGE
ncbi:MAG: hypothetical protein ACR2RV_13570 [Verrucomicrobiales bacterium]